MDLTTRCPQCGTIFSASLEQLQLRKGYIRCINCAHIFDGYDAVVSGAGDAARKPAGAAAAVPAAPAARPAPAAPAAQRPPAAPIAGRGSEAGAAAAPAAMPSVLRQRRPKEEPRFAAAPAPARVAPAGPAHPAFSISSGDRNAERALRQDPVFRIDAAAPATPDSAAGARPEPVIGGGRMAVPAPPQIYVEPRPAEGGDGRSVPDFLDGEAPRYRGVVKMFWGALIAAGLLLLLAQLAYVYRSQIANQIPALRPVLVRACASLNCQVAYSRHIDQISIMSSSLRASTGAGGAAADAAADSMTLQLTMRNNYGKPQEWPTLVLDLTDFSGTLVVRKNLAPASYLPPAALRQPFAASSEITVGVPIVLNGLKVNGYQLGKFFP